MQNNYCRKHPLEIFFTPSSIAVIGASRKHTKIGYETLKNLLVYDYKGKVYAVNPNAATILGVPCFKSVLDIPDKIELAIIVVPANKVNKVLQECGEKGIKAVIIISSGFLEIGEKKLVDNLLQIVKKYNIRVLGPNTMGIKNPVQGVDASFVFSMPPPGRIAVVSQSGALSVGFIHLASMEKIGLSKVIGMGNKLDIDDADILDYLSYDTNTDVIAMYIEGLKDGRKFLNAVKNCKKPVVVVKAGRTQVGAMAAQSHTGALAGSDAIYDSVFKQTNIIRAKDIIELFDIANALANQPLPNGDRVGIVSNGGGLGILLADACVENGLKVPQFEDLTLKKLRNILPDMVKPRNPVDLVADATFYRYEAASIAVMEDRNVDALIIACVHGGYARPREYAGAVMKVVDMQKQNPYKKPVIACWIGGTEINDLIDALKEKHIPVYPSTTRAATSLAALVKISLIKGKSGGGDDDKR